MITNVDENINKWLSQIQIEHKTAISVDCVIFGYDEENLKVLTIKSDMPPFEGKYSLVGDLVTSHETLGDAASRILKERTGLDSVILEQVEAFSTVDRHPLARVITIAYYSLIKIENHQLDLAYSSFAEWQDVASIGEMAFDHKEILDTCLSRLRSHLLEKPVGFSLLPKKFSLRQLQRLYEVVLDIEIDKRNFRRKLNSLGILVDINETQQDVTHRPAKLYTFDMEAYRAMGRRGFNLDM